MTLPSRSKVEQTLAIIQKAGSALDLPIAHTSREQEKENHVTARELIDVEKWVRELSAEVERLTQKYAECKDLAERAAGLEIERDRLRERLAAIESETK
jgi:hypothetical protein